MDNSKFYEDAATFATKAVDAEGKYQWEEALANYQKALERFLTGLKCECPAAAAGGDGRTAANRRHLRCTHTGLPPRSLARSLDGLTLQSRRMRRARA